jgi:hypothetical protein
MTGERPRRQLSDKLLILNTSEVELSGHLTEEVD